MSLKEIFEGGAKNTGCVMLPNDFSSWHDKILAETLKRVPNSSNVLVRINYKQKNEEKGYAVGSIVLTDKESKKQATVPMIIKDYKLFPLDVMIVDGNFVPLDEHNYNKFFLSSSLFTKTIPRQDFDMASPYISNDLYTQTHPPYHVKQGSVLDNIIDTIDRRDIKSFKSALRDNPESMAYLDANVKTASILKKICSHNPEPFEKKASREKIASVDVMCIERCGFNKYKVMSNDSSCFNPSVATWDYDMVKQAGIPMDWVSKDEYFAKSASKASPMVEEDMVSNDIYNPKPISKRGVYTVRNTEGVSYSGMVIPYVIDFNQKPVDMKYFISGDNYAYQKDIVGVFKDEAVKLDEGNLEAGANGMFVYEDGRGVIATVPFEVIGLSKDETQSIVEVYARNALGRSLVLRMLPGIQQIIPSPTNINTYNIPIEMKFVRLGERLNLVSNPSTYKSMEKVAFADVNKLRIVNNGLTYSFKAAGLEKYAGTGMYFGALKEPEAVFTLMSFGCDPSQARGLLKTAEKKGGCTVHGLMYPGTVSEQEKVAKQNNERYNDLYQHIGSLKCNLVKEAGKLAFADDTEYLSSIFISKDDRPMYKLAAEMDSSETIDKVLSLNFINKSNISKFIEMKSVLELAMSKLAQLLIASRLGMKNIPEQETSVALNNMSYVVEGLDLLSDNK